MKAEEVLLALSVKNEGDWKGVYKDIADKKALTDAEVEAAVNSMKGKGVGWTTIVSDDYPAALKGVQHPPFVIFYKGDFDLAKEKLAHITCIGGDGGAVSEYGKRAVVRITLDMAANKFRPISSSKSRCDIIHGAASECGNPGIMVLDCGFEAKDAGIAGGLYLNRAIDGGKGCAISLYPPEVGMTRSSDALLEPEMLAHVLAEGRDIIAELGPTKPGEDAEKQIEEKLGAQFAIEIGRSAIGATVVVPHDISEKNVDLVNSVDGAEFYRGWKACEELWK